MKNIMKNNVCLLVCILFILTCLTYTIDILIDNQYQHCKSIHSILWTHHFIFWFLLLGWISNDKRFLIVYLISVLCVLIDWENNDGSCSLTLRLNSMCNLPSNRQFRDAMYWLGIKDLFNGKLYDILMSCALLLVIIKLIY